MHGAIKIGAIMEDRGASPLLGEAQERLLCQIGGRFAVPQLLGQVGVQFPAMGENEPSKILAGQTTLPM